MIHASMRPNSDKARCAKLLYLIRHRYVAVHSDGSATCIYNFARGMFNVSGVASRENHLGSSAENAFAHARPMPLEAPAITTTCSLIFFVIVSLRSRC